MAYDPTEKDLQIMQTGKLMQASADVILPLLEKQREDAISAIIWAFRSNEIAKLQSLAATLSTIDSMKSEIKNKIAKANKLEEKIYADGNAD
jgi:hypothetical protein